MKAVLEARRNTTAPEWSPVWETDAEALRADVRALFDVLGGAP